jgi:hypothetical protein
MPISDLPPATLPGPISARHIRARPPSPVTALYGGPLLTNQPRGFQPQEHCFDPLFPSLLNPGYLLAVPEKDYE